MPAPTDHYRLSPSKSSTWLVCPFSLTAPPSPPSKSAEEGTEAHDWAAGCVTGERSIVNAPKKFAAGVGMYVEHVHANGVEPIVERQWHSLEIPDYAGTIDCLLVHERHLVVYDFKFGKWNVEAAGNTQLLCYSDIAREHFDVDTFHGVIVQPRAWKGDKIKVAEYSAEEVDSHRERVKWAVANPDHKEWGEHCRFCELRKQKMCQEGVAYGRMEGWK